VNEVGDPPDAEVPGGAVQPGDGLADDARVDGRERQPHHDRGDTARECAALPGQSALEGGVRRLALEVAGELHVICYQ